MLQLRGVSKSYPLGSTAVSALREVDVDVPGGLLTTVLGPSGSGKSTLLRLVAGFERPDRGTVRLDGRLLAGPGEFVRAERRGIGIVVQDGALFPHLDVAANVAFGLSGRRTGRKARVAELLDMVGLPGYQRRRADELSGGEQQRVALARALAPRPDVILLDEPFSAIDAALRADLGAQVRALLRELQVTTLLVTHDQAEALSLGDRMVVMRDGRIAQADTPQRVYEHPVDAATARFVGDAMVLPAYVVDGLNAAPRVRCVLGDVPVVPGTALAAGARCQVVVRPEHVVLSDEPADEGPRPGVPARVIGTEYYGHDAMLTVRTDGEEAGEIRVRVHDIDPTSFVGRPVRVEVRGRALVLR